MSALPDPLHSSLSTSGYSDGLGRRSVRFDREFGGMLEALELRPELALYEPLLYDAATHLASISDSRIAKVRSIEREGRTLVVLSEQVAGERLEDILEARAADDFARGGIDAALGFLHRALPALRVLHAGGLVHGTIAPGRVALTQRGDVVLLDCIYARAVEHLRLPRQKLWSSLALVAPMAVGSSRFERADDLRHLILAALAIALGRNVTEGHKADAVARMLQEVTEVAQIRSGDRFAVDVRALLGNVPAAGLDAPPSLDDVVTEVDRLARKLGIEACLSALADVASVRPARVESAPLRPAATLPSTSVLELVPDRPSVTPSKPRDMANSFGPLVLDPNHAIAPSFDTLNDTEIFDWTPEPEPVVAAKPPQPRKASPPPVEAVVQSPDANKVSEPQPVAPAPVIEAPAPFEAEIEQSITEVAAEPLQPPPATTPEPRPPQPPPGILLQQPVAVVPAAPVEPVRPAPSAIATPSPEPLAPPAPPPPAPVPFAPAPAATLPPPGPVLYAPPPPVVIARPVPVMIAPPPVPVPVPPLVPAFTPPAPLRLKTEVPQGFVRPRRILEDGADDAGTYRGPTTRPPSRGVWKFAAAACIILAVGGFAGWSYLDGAVEQPATTEQTTAPAPAKEPAAAVGGLRIETQPAGAAVLLDGEDVGRTPLQLDAVKPGRHTVTLSTDSASVKRTIRVEAGKVVNLDVAVYSGWVAIYSPVPLHVSEGSRSLGTTESTRIMLSPGRHELTLTNREFGYSAKQSVDIAPGEERVLNVEPKGTVSVNALPWAEVWVDGQRMGDTPLAHLEVPLGTREFVFKHPSHGERKLMITVSSKTAPISIDLTKSGTRP